jgi:hypothetical protein
MSYFLSIDKNKVKISRYTGGPGRIVKSLADFNEYMAAEAKMSGVKVEDIPVMKSSSIDFPEDFTNDPKVIALAKELA